MDFLVCLLPLLRVRGMSDAQARSTVSYLERLTLRVTATERIVDEMWCKYDALIDSRAHYHARLAAHYECVRAIRDWRNAESRLRNASHRVFA
jgi:hypothetical protein